MDDGHTTTCDCATASFWLWGVSDGCIVVMYLTYQFIEIFIYRDCFCQHLLSRRDTGNAF